MSEFDNELDGLGDPPIPDGSDPSLDPETSTISHEERDDDGNIIRDKPDYVDIEDRVAPFTNEENTLLNNSRNKRTMQGLLALGVLFWLGA